jgi:PAS domain S-box-containing protein
MTPGKFPELDATTRLLQLVMDNIPQFIFWKDRNSVYLGCNANFAQVAGVGSPENIVGKTDFDLAWKHEEAEFFRQVDARVMSTNTPEYHIIEPQQHADGKQAWLDTNKIPLHDAAGNVVGILGTYEDITTRKQAEEALRHAQKMDSIGQLAGGVAHDFNNMLVGILGAAELLRRGKVAVTERDALLDLIVHSGRRAADLTGKLLTFSRRGRMQARLLDVHQAIDDALAILSRSIDRRVEIHRHFDAELAIVRGDPAELESAILNLGINARDAMPDGGVLEITTSVRELTLAQAEATSVKLKPGQYLQIDVRDSGHGIPLAIQSRVFEPFFTTKGQGLGTGLGLSAVYGAITEHGGTIRLQSEPGRGTLFEILLPLSRGDTLQPTPVSQRPSDHGEPGTVLVIDDEDAIRTVSSLMLRELGYDVLTAEDGVAGLALFEANRAAIRAVLLDVNMPHLDGRDCLKQLQKLDPNVRVIMCSGFTEEALERDGADSGIAVFLKKPFRREDLAAAVSG